MGFERYTDRARRALDIATDEARNLGLVRVGAGHLLLGLIGEDGGVAAVALKSLGADLGEARHAMGRGAIHGVQPPPGPIPFTSRARGVLDQAATEAAQLGSPYIATEHLLLALISDSDGTGNDVLVAIGINPGDARARVLELLRGYEETAAPVDQVAGARKYDGTDPDLPDGWLHEDGTPCPEYLAPDNGTRWWCTEHQQYLKRPDGPGPLSAALEPIRAGLREAGLAGLGSEDAPAGFIPAALYRDARSLLAAVDEVLKLHTEAVIEDLKPEPFHYCSRCPGHPKWPCPEVRAITRALTGGGGDGG